VSFFKRDNEVDVEVSPADFAGVLHDDDVIRAEHLVKSFGKLIAVDDLTLGVRKGEIYGFLGPNGAGKTTTLSMLTTMDLPDSGAIRLGECDAIADRINARRGIGVVQQQHSLEKEISVRENIVHHGLMQNMSQAAIRENMSRLCERMQLTDRLDTLVRDLSGGWKKRAAIVCSLIHNPQILFMDEPATGLDTQSRALLHQMIRSINNDGTTIFLTTHYMFEAEDLCDRVGIINAGHFIAEGTPEELRGTVGPFTLVVTDETGAEHVSFFSTRAEAQQASLDVADACAIQIREANLEDVFLELTGRKL
jgi:ABC-2 type transport system ATP-binding protein